MKEKQNEKRKHSCNDNNNNKKNTRRNNFNKYWRVRLPHHVKVICTWLWLFFELNCFTNETKLLWYKTPIHIDGWSSLVPYYYPWYKARTLCENTMEMKKIHQQIRENIEKMGLRMLLIQNVTLLKWIYRRHSILCIHFFFEHLWLCLCFVSRLFFSSVFILIYFNCWKNIRQINLLHLHIRLKLFHLKIYLVNRAKLIFCFICMAFYLLLVDCNLPHLI